MNRQNSERLLALAKEILDQEKKAKDLYEEYIEKIKDTSTIEVLRRILEDEKAHIKLASEVLGTIQHGSTYTRLRDGLDRLSETNSILISCGIENYLKVNTIVLKYLVNEKGSNCIYVAINKPCSSLIETFKRESIDTNKLSFVECATVSTESKEAILVKPDNLTDVTMSISRLIEKTPGRKFVYMDALSTLYIFNPGNVVERFAHHLISSTKLKKTGLILVSVKEEIEEKSMAVLTTFCDKKIEV